VADPKVLSYEIKTKLRPHNYLNSPNKTAHGVHPIPIDASLTHRKGKPMKIVALVARILMGLAFLVVGLNGFLHFIPSGPMPTGTAGQFVGALIASHYFMVVAGLQILGGALLLVNRYVPLALVILGPVIVNIFFFHLLMDPSGLPRAIAVVVLWGIVAGRNWQYFSGIFTQRTSEASWSAGHGASSHGDFRSTATPGAR
jgi:putative oxidoreductase